MSINLTRLIISLVICQLAGIIGGVFTANSVRTWYLTLVKPGFNPPSWVFGPVWILLFLMMGVSLYLVWTVGIDNPAVKIAIIVFAVQLVLNICWSLLFFGLCHQNLVSLPRSWLESSRCLIFKVYLAFC